MRWSLVVGALLFAPSARAEKIVATDGFSIDVDTTGACVLVPADRKTASDCAGVAPLPTTLPTIDGADARYVYLASVPLGSAGRYWFGVIRIANPTAGGLSLEKLATMEGALRSLTTRLGDFDVSPASASPVRTKDGIDYASIAFDASARGDASRRFASSFALYFGAAGYVVQTFAESVHATEVDERRLAATRTIVLDGRRPARPTLAESARKLGERAATIGGLATLFLFVVWQALTARARSKRDASRTDLSAYAGANRIGDVVAVTLFAGSLLHALCLLALVPLLVWVRRVVKNARALGFTAVPTSTMAVVWFFVPVAQAFMPYRALCRVAACARRARDRTTIVSCLAVWWLSWIAGNVLREDGWPMLAALCIAGAAFAFWIGATTIERDQELLRQKLSAASAPPPPC